MRHFDNADRTKQLLSAILAVALAPTATSVTESAISGSRAT